MCGIFGYFDRNGKSLESETIRKMGDVIKHRGPDDSGVFEGPGVALGNQRLSIIDVEGGHQPFCSDDGKIIVVQNGEIFNHVELAEDLAASGYPLRTHCDTEVILRLYERDGLDLVHQLNGMFAIAILDQNLNELHLIRDRIGVKPLFLHDDGSRLTFGSEIKSILATGVNREVDHEALDLFLAYNFVPPPFTMFHQVRHLLPGHLLTISKTETKYRKWWNLNKQSQEMDKSEQYWIGQFNEILEDAVKIRMRSDVPFGAFLSGGVDSSTVVGLMSRHSTNPIKTFCIGFDDARFDESRFASDAARRFETEHHCEVVSANMFDAWQKVIYHCDQPHGDVSFLPTLRVSSLASREVKMVLTGDGGDELFAGYDKYKNFFTEDIDQLSDIEFRDAYYRNLNLFKDQDRQELYSEKLRRTATGYNPKKIIEDVFEQCKHMDRINQALMIDMSLLLPGNNLVKPDRMGMAVSLEARTPFLDYRMMEFAFRIPGNLKLKNGTTKYIFKKAVEGLIGTDLAYRKKQMFTVPVGEWFKDELRDTVEDLLLSKKARERNLFNYHLVENMIKKHVNESENFTREIRALVAIELWFQQFIDRQ